MNVQAQFPILNRKINEKSLVYFDNAATSQKPQAVIDAISNFYESHNANVHRSMNPLADEATKMYEAARDKVRAFINARSRQEIIFTSGATAGINLVAQSWGRQNLKKGDRVIVSIAEHHANFVPWLQRKEQIEIEIDYIPLQRNTPPPLTPPQGGESLRTASHDLNQGVQRDFPSSQEGLGEVGSIDVERGMELLQQKNVKLLAMTLCSNVLGRIESEAIKELCRLAKEKNIVTLVDVAQAIAHTPVDVQELGCDFLVFSGHKMFSPTGIGVLYGRKELLEVMPAWQGGGDMIQEVHTNYFTPNDLPYKFEAGTPHIAGAVGLGAAIDFINEVRWSEIEKQERELAAYFLHKIKETPFVKLYGPASVEHRAPVFSFTIDNVHAHDAADLLGQQGIIVRAGHHCAQPLHEYLNVPATLRASLAFYNTEAEVDVFFSVLKDVYTKMTNY